MGRPSEFDQLDAWARTFIEFMGAKPGMKVSLPPRFASLLGEATKQKRGISIGEFVAQNKEYVKPSG